MDLIEYLIMNRKQAIDKWYKTIIDTYPMDSSKLFLGVNDKFANPVGYTFEKCLPEVFDNLVQGKAAIEISGTFDEIIRLRAVQNFSPAEATGFLFLLKNVVREMVADEEMDWDAKGLLKFESEIDKSVSFCFDKYMDIKQKLFEIKANEMKATFGRMVDRLNKKYGSNPNE